MLTSGTVSGGWARDRCAAAGWGEDARVSRRARRRTARPAEVADEDVVERLEELYAALPALECRGLCGHSCSGHVDASAAERARITAAGVDLDAPTVDGACPALSRAVVPSGRCAVHPVRPMICRLWGTAAAMPCPHGCTPAGGHLSDRQVLEAMLASYDAGGHQGTAAARDAGMADLLRACTGDEAAAGLLARFLRGDRTVTTALAARVGALRSTTVTASARS